MLLFFQYLHENYNYVFAFYAKIKYYNHLYNYFTKILEWELDFTLNITMITSQHDDSKAII